MKIFILSVFLVLAANLAFAQSTLHGQVNEDNTHSPLSGATIFVTELNKGTSTGTDGEYSINGLKQGIYTIVISHIGYGTTVEEVIVKGNTTLNVELHTEPLRLNDVVISSAFINPRNENTYRVEVVRKEEMQRKGAVTVMDQLEEVPGVDAITSGPLVSRPVIRGLSGNRVLTVVDGARFETQQWDDEHGIGVNELGLDRIEVIMGPGSLLYGPEAMGGVIRFVDEQPAEAGTIKGNALATLYSNNLGANANVTIKGAEEGFNWGVNALGRLLSDYFYDGYDFRVPNTRLLEYGGKAYGGLNKHWGSTTLTYTFNKAYYGILDGKDIIKDSDGRIINIDSLEKEKFPLEIEAPFHEVTDHRINSKTTILTGRSKVEAILGYQNNHRSENEELAGKKQGYTYVDMVLQTATYDIKYYLPEWHNFHTIIGTQGLLQRNSNKPDAATLLVPDARIHDEGFLALTKWDYNGLNISAGARYDSRHLESVRSELINDDMPVLSRSYGNLSYSLGASYRPTDALLVRGSFASGYRAPNLNELFSDGVKLESQRYEVGNPDFTKEQNRQADLGIGYEGAGFSIEGNVFTNDINNVIYLAPTGNMRESDIEPGRMAPEYIFLQDDAHLRGGEIILDIHPAGIKWGHFETKASTLKATLEEKDDYLPMMPPTRVFNTVYLKFGKVFNLHDFFFNIGTETALRQDQVADNEQETPSYTLLNLSAGARYHKTEFILTANNLLDKAYLDHMSRFRSYEIFSPGLNISFSVKVPLDIKN